MLLKTASASVSETCPCRQTVYLTHQLHPSACLFKLLRHGYNLLKTFTESYAYVYAPSGPDLVCCDSAT